jgi:hypothetical protein
MPLEQAIWRIADNDRKTEPLVNAIKEVGLFGNQNSVCQPITPKWNHTVERLKQLFGIE